MPPKQSSSTVTRGRPPGPKNKAAANVNSSGAVQKSNAKSKGKERAQPSASPESQHSADAMNVDIDDGVEDPAVEQVSDDEEPEKTIPPDLLTRILHEFFEKDGTRITKDANNTVAKYMDVFVKEAIARAAAERKGGFLEVEDLEKIAPQLLLDL